MFSTEFDQDEISITVLDDKGNYEDVNYLLYDDIIYIRQWDNDLEKYHLIAMSPKMLQEFLEAMKNPEGFYYIKGG